MRGRYVTVGDPIELSASPTKITPAPHLGEHRRDVLRELGYAEADIDALEADGATSSAARTLSAPRGAAGCRARGSRSPR